MKKLLAFAGASLFLWVGLHAQSTDDYRSAGSGPWNSASTWERYNGTTWVSAPSSPNQNNGVITIRAPHTITLPTGTVFDQLTIEPGATATSGGLVVVLDGTGLDLNILGTYDMTGGNLIGPGNISIGGSFSWSSGSIGGPTYMNTAFTHVDIASTGSVTIIGTNQKFIDRARIINQGIVNWNGGEWHLYSTPGADTSKFVNYGTLNLGAGSLTSYGQPPARFVNKPGAIVNKATTDTYQFGTGTNFQNYGSINISDGTFSTNNQNAAFHNYGSVNCTANGTFDGKWNVLLYSGSSFTGTGSIIANGVWQLIGPCSIAANATLTQNGGNIVGVGPLTIHGTYVHNAGSAGGPSYMNSGFTEIIIATTGTYNLGTAAQKFIDRGKLINYGTTNWNGGEWHLGSTPGADTTKFVNYGTLHIGAGSLTSFGQPPARFVNKPGATMNKVTTGTYQFGTGTNFQNYGSINISDGTFSTNNQNAFFHNWGTINTTATGTFDARWNVNLHIGSFLTGNGTYHFEGNINATGTAVVDTGSTISLVGGIVGGTGPFTLNGSLNWTGGSFGDYWWTKSNIIITPTGTVTCSGSGQRDISRTVFTNNGTLNWNAANLSLASTVGTDTCILYNNGLFHINVSTGSLLGQSNTHVRNLAGGTILHTQPGNINVQSNITFKNWGTVGGIGTLTMNAQFVPDGTIAPGLSPGAFTFNNAQPFGANSTFLVELNDNSGPGLGHDLLERNGNITIAGNVEVVETGIVPNGTYTIVNLTSGTVSGGFSFATLPAGYSVDTTATTVFLVKDFRHLMAVTDAICDDDSLWFNGQWLTTAGVYVDTLLTTNGLFDSIVTLTLAVNPSYLNTQTETACFSYTWPVNGLMYTQSDTVAISQSTSAGCDSTHLLYLTIHMVDTSVTVQGTTLTANAANAQYQWFDCALGIPIPGATARTFTPTNSGIYYVEVTQNGCTEISGCRQITVQNAQTEAILIYPVPINDYLTISLRDPASTLSGAVFDAAGHLMDVQTVQNTRILKLDFRSYAAGVYLIRIETAGKEEVYKVEKL